MRTSITAGCLLVAGVVGVGGAIAHSGSSRGNEITITPGNAAVFKLAGGGEYHCLNQRRQFSCVAGDALPDVTVGPKTSITVHTLNGGHLAIRAQHKPPPDAGMSAYETINYTFTP